MRLSRIVLRKDGEYSSTFCYKITGLTCGLISPLTKRFLLIFSTAFVSFISQDPTSALLQLAENSGMSNRFHALSLGQGQAPIATRMIKEGVKDVRLLPPLHLKTFSIFPHLYKVVLTFKSVDKTLVCDHSNESY